MVTTLLALATLAQPTDFFPFVLPWDAAPNQTAVDVSFLNHKPAGKNGWVRPNAQGHFVESKTGRRVRFFGTNVGARAAFPLKQDAHIIAARMAKLGINVVRFHHLNNGWDLDGGTIWKPGRTHIEIDPVQLDKIDYFVAALKKQGIYTNFNLQTSREMVPELGFPESVRQIPNFQKKVDKVDRRMIELQKQYAKDLLDRTNPYTGLKYKDDPAVIVVEINNENSLAGWPGESPGSGVGNWPEPFRGDFKRKWNQWLLDKYGSDERLAQAWPTSRDLTGPSLLNNQNTWTKENQSQGDVSFRTIPGTGAADKAPTLEATVRSNAGPDWHVQAHLQNLTLQEGQTYTLSFRAKSDRPLSFNVDTRLNVEPWTFLGLNAAVTTNNEWQDVDLTFVARGCPPGQGRVSLVLGLVRGSVTIADATLRKGSVSVGLKPGESAEQANISFPTPTASPRFRDWCQFIVETETAYSQEMRAFLRDTLGFKNTNIIDTQIAWGGLTGPTREAQMEFADNHAYWNHPVFFNGDWNPRDYRVNRRSMVNELGRSNGEFAGLVAARLIGKPYSVSEYNHPAPNDYQVEMMPLYGFFAAFQDWDKIYTFAWDDTGSRTDNTRYENYFDVAKNPAKSAFFPSVAIAFRTGAFPSATGLQTLALPERAWERAVTQAEAFARWGQNADPLKFRVGMTIQPGLADPLFTTIGQPTPAFNVTGPVNRQIFLADSPQAKSVVGFVAGQEIAVGDANFTFGQIGSEAFSDGFAALTLVSTDGKPIANSSRVLLTVAARVENQNMGWNQARDSVSDNWGTGPVQAEFVPLTTAVPADGPRKIYALDPSGNRKAELPSEFRDNTVRFQTNPQNPSLWIEIAK